MDEQRETLILHSPDQSKALPNPYEKPSKKKAQPKYDSGLDIDMGNVFHRLHCTQSQTSQPCSAQSNAGSKIRLLKLLNQDAGMADAGAGAIGEEVQRTGRHWSLVDAFVWLV
jgi:hypothetical protein